ncbi:MAG: putative 4-hydroxybenzoate polyprenyltransferase [Gemmatimonadales bacterium]
MSAAESRAVRYARFVKLEHTGFALPFALVGAILASYRYPVTAWDVLWIVVAFTAARFAAMAFNRVVDRDFDARNPRTAGREIPTGAISVREGKLAVVVASAVFVLAAGMLNPLCLALSPVALASVLGYSYAKRYTSATHLILGLADGIAPSAGYLAIAGRWSDPWMLLPILTMAVGLWIGGFDILYSMQDVEADRRLGLHSIPARYGVRWARWFAAAFHVGTVICLLAVPIMVPELGAGYMVALLVTTALIGVEHGLVDPESPESIHHAFFTINVWIASAFAILVLVDRIL